MEWGCCTRRKQTYTFEHGTYVIADSSFRAIELLRSISLKNLAEMESDGPRQWIVKFQKNAFIRVEATGPTQARQAAEWMVYLDRREARIVEQGLVHP